MSSQDGLDVLGPSSPKASHSGFRVKGQGFGFRSISNCGFALSCLFKVGSEVQGLALLC